MEAIHVEGLRKSYKRVEERFFLLPRKVRRIEALKSISFSVKRGEVVGYLGPNGSGKSTTIKILSGVLYPDDGRVSVLGYTPWERKEEFLKSIGVMFGHRSFLFWEIPVIDTFLFYKEAYKIDKDIFEDRVEYLSELLDIGEYLETPARELSLGERIRCEMALTLLHDPDVVLLDEPFLGIDVWTREKIREFLKRLGKEGKTILLSSHQLEDVEEIVERVILLNKGEIVFDGKLSDLKRLINWKRVIVTFYKPPRKLEYMKRTVGNIVELKVPRKEVKRIVQELLEEEVMDLTVEEPKLEEVLKHVVRDN